MMPTNIKDLSSADSQFTPHYKHTLLSAVIIKAQIKAVPPTWMLLPHLMDSR